jgi:hypothetical protein
VELRGIEPVLKNAVFSILLGFSNAWVTEFSTLQIDSNNSTLIQ